MKLIHQSVLRAIRTASRYQDLPAIATSNHLAKPGLVPVNLPSAIRHEAQKSNRRTIHSTNPCIDPPRLKHLLLSTLAIDLSIYVKDKNSFTEKVSYDLTSLGFFSVSGEKNLSRLKLKVCLSLLLPIKQMD